MKMSFSPQWESMFSLPSNLETAAPRLGINFIAASAAETTIGKDLTIQQDLRHMGIAGVLWNCARVLVTFLEEHPEFVAGRQVVELGTGTGAVGLAMALSCDPLRVVMTDLFEVVEQLTRRNVSAAAETHSKLKKMVSEGRLSAMAHSWGSEPTSLLTGCEVVLCSDCLYEPRCYDGLLTTLRALRPATVYLAYKQRHCHREREFFEAASEQFQITVWSETGREATPFLGEAIFVCCLCKKTKPHVTKKDL